MGHREEVRGQLVVAGGNPAEVFEFGEEALDEVPLPVEPSAEIRLGPAIGLRWDIGERASLPESYPDAIGVIGLVSQNDGPRSNMIE